MVRTTGTIQDIIVTTPKNKTEIAEEEARQCIEAGSGFYFRTFRNTPRHLGIGSRIFYIEDGYVRGFGMVSEIKNGDMQCGTTGYDWGDGTHAIIQSDSWKWIKPIPMRGFQGWRYFKAKSIKIVGNWLDPKPLIKGVPVIKIDWKTSEPPKRKNRPVKLRYQDSSGKIHQGSFVWSDGENTWVECAYEGVGLYADDGWKVLGWK